MATRCCCWMPTLTFSELPHQGLALQKKKKKKRGENVRLFTLNQNQHQTKKNWQSDSLYSVPVMWARTRKDLDCSWAALLAQSAGPRLSISLGMTAWYTGEALSITRSLTGRLLQPQKEPILWNTHFLFKHDGGMLGKVVILGYDWDANRFIQKMFYQFTVQCITDCS